MLNVALGGTLEQHIERLDVHRHTPGAFCDHAVRLEPGSLAARAVGAERTGVKSHHHQGVEDLGEGDGDGDGAGRSAKAIEVPDRRFALGVLWHPEEDEQSRVVGALVAAARAGDVIEVVEPATGSVMAEVPRAGAEETDAAVARAKAAFPDWPPSAPVTAALLRLADALDAAHEDLARTEARNARRQAVPAMPAPEMQMVVETLGTTRARPSACWATSRCPEAWT